MVMRLSAVAAVVAAGLWAVGGAWAQRSGGNRPLPLDEQRKLAERHGYQIAPGPDAARPDDPPLAFDPASRAAGAAVFVRDYNLPMYPDSRIGQAELGAAALIESARGEIEPLSLGVHALADLKGLTVQVGPLVGPGGAALPADSVRVRYLEDAYVRGGGAPRVRAAPPVRADGEAPAGPRPGQTVAAQPAGATTQPDRRGGFARRTPTAILAPLRLRPVEPLDLASGVNRQFWIDVSVPASAAPGDYAGAITVRSQGRPDLVRPLTVRVRRFELIEPKDFFIGAFMSLPVRGAPTRQTLAEFKAQGIDGMLWFWSESSWTVVRDGETIRQDFTRISRIIDDAVAVGMKGPVVVCLGNDHKGYYERRLAQLFDRPLRPAEEVGGKTAEVAALDDEVINRLYVEGVRQFTDDVRTRKDWPEVVLMHYDEATERLMPEAALRYEQIKRASPATRVYGVTMSRLAWAEAVAPISDILVCNGSFDEIRDLGRRLGKAVWGYSGAPASNGSGGARFNMGWRLWRYGLGSHWFWCYNFHPGDPWNEFDDRTGDANWVTVYPSPRPGEHVPTLAWEGIREAKDDLRYAATLLALLETSPAPQPLRDEIAAKYRKFVSDIPAGRDRTSFRGDQDEFYSTLPSYHRLTEMRRQLVEWIEQLLGPPVQ